ncbi:hypothetical protein GCM10023184_08440 [Flaviaesturariibacter amylovorans]|uniref:Two-component sensor histidine kinase n=1 Tax=Flaviaesturariibacter amylovorans TaxID=1084520 RepID=A0ABP8GDD3_9BACT
MLVSLFLVVTILHMLVYATVQQVYRSGANVPQERLCDALVEALVDGKAPAALLPPDSLDLAATRQPFVLLYSPDGSPLRGTAFLDKQLPKVPRGVLEHARRNGVHRVTWAPREGLRIALVVKRVPQHPELLVAAGRSLQYTEQQTYKHWRLVLLSWIACCAVLVFYSIMACRPPAPLPAPESPNP